MEDTIATSTVLLLLSEQILDQVSAQSNQLEVIDNILVQLKADSDLDALLIKLREQQKICNNLGKSMQQKKKISFEAFVQQYRVANQVETRLYKHEKQKLYKLMQRLKSSVDVGQDFHLFAQSIYEKVNKGTYHPVFK